MNAAIRAVTRTCIAHGFSIKGIYRGYEGLMTGEVAEFTSENVSNIIARGGTILKSARSKAFMTKEGGPHWPYSRVGWSCFADRIFGQTHAKLYIVG